MHYPSMSGSETDFQIPGVVREFDASGYAGEVIIGQDMDVIDI